MRNDLRRPPSEFSDIGFGSRSLGHEGSAFVAMMLLVFATLSLTVSALLSARSGLTIASNYQTGLQGMMAAEAAVVHAQTAIEQYGVGRFDTQVVSNWPVVFGSSTRTMPGYSRITYTVTASNDTTDPVTFMWLDAVGRSPGEGERSVRVRLQRGMSFSPGAIYLPDPAVSTNFNGNSFLIDGNDRNLNGTASTNPPAPGIGTSTGTSATAVTSSLNAQQEDNIIGAGGYPSVFMSPGPSASRVQTEIVPDILSRPGVVTNPTLHGNDVFGTVQSPQITYFTGNVTINGSLTGAGILVVDQALTINGNASFTGLIIVRGSTDITAVSGSATVLGSLWTTDLNLTVSGSASITYSTQALALADALSPNQSFLPHRVNAVSWREL